MEGGPPKATFPWAFAAAVFLVGMPLPFLPHVLVPGSVDAAERLEPGGRQFVQSSFDLFAGDVLAGRVSVRSGPAVNVYVMDEAQFQALGVAGFVEPSFSASGTIVNFSYTTSKSGTFHVVVGHSPGNETTESAIDVTVSTTVNPLVVAATLGSEGAGFAVFLWGLRGYSRAVLEREKFESGRVARREKPRK